MITPEIHELIKQTREKYEFLTFMFTENDENWICGVVQNFNGKMYSFYDLSKVRDEKAKLRFMSHADRWWWESGMSLPIDAYIGRAFDEFRDSLTQMPIKALSSEPLGPVYNITEHYLIKVKKRRIELVAD